MVVLVHENHDKWPNVTAVQHFSRGFDYSNLVNSFRGSKQKFDNIRFSYVYILEFEHLKCYIWQK